MKKEKVKVVGCVSLKISLEKLIIKNHELDKERGREEEYDEGDFLLSTENEVSCYANIWFNLNYCKLVFLLVKLVLGCHTHAHFYLEKLEKTAKQSCNIVE